MTVLQFDGKIGVPAASSALRADIFFRVIFFDSVFAFFFLIPKKFLFYKAFPMVKSPGGAVEAHSA